MEDRVIFHIDVNSAFLSWEAVYRIKHLGGTIDLRDIPSAVGGDVSKRHGIILAKSIPAKAYDVKTAQTIMEALRNCPNLVVVPPNFEVYEKASKAFMNILREYSPDVEQYSIDEAFIDMTGTRKLFGEPVVVATSIRERIYRELGFTVNIGIADNKLLAKMASDFEKPNKVHTLFRSEIKQKMWPLPVGDLFFVGRATAKKLKMLGINTIGELASTDLDILRSHLKKHGELIWSFANGLDTSVVETQVPANKGYGNSTTIAFDVSDETTAKMVLLALAETVGRRLRKDGVRISVVSVGIKSFELEYSSHQMVLDTSTNITNEIHAAVCRLFDELWDGTPIRHLSIHTSRIAGEDEGRQLSLFDNTDYERLEKLDKAVDSIRERFGTDSIKRAAFIGNERIDHVGGGIRRDNKTVDYKKEQVK